MNFTLCVRNIAPDKKIKDEIICDIDLISSSVAQQLQMSFNTSSTMKLVVDNYSREEKILTIQSELEAAIVKGSLLTSLSSFSISGMVCSRMEDEKKLAGKCHSSLLARTHISTILRLYEVFDRSQESRIYPST
jgi:hypothetical protein